MEGVSEVHSGVRVTRVKTGEVHLQNESTAHVASTVLIQHLGISPQSCTETDFEMKTSNVVLFLLISVVSVHFRAIYDETIRCQA